MPVMNRNGVAAWVAEHANVDVGIAATVLDIEFEHMAAMGLVTSDPPGIEFEYHYYTPDDVAGLEGSRCVDTYRVAQDVDRFTGIDVDTSLTVLAWELEYLEMRGLA